MKRDERQVLVRFTGPQGKVIIRFHPDEVPSNDHELMKELAIERADPGGRRKVVECRVIK